MTQRTAAQTKLAAIATDMYAHLAAGAAWHHRVRPNGLELVLQRNGDQWRLAIAREGVTPADPEVDAVRQAFSVPVDVEPVRTQKTRPMPKTTSSLAPSFRSAAMRSGYSGSISRVAKWRWFSGTVSLPSGP